MKVVIIGAGSGFGGRLSVDILAVPALQDVTIALCDTNAKSLENIRKYVQRTIDGHKLPAKVIASTDRNELLPGADCVVTAVSVGGPSYWGEPYRSEIHIPRSYGVDQAVGDTIGPGGVFRFLRTAPVHLSFCKDMEIHCPEALLLNYTNPMAMLTWLHSRASSIRNVGLCHSVQGTTKKLAKACGVDYANVHYQVAGINHQAWILKLMDGQRDMYPKLRSIAHSSDVLAEEKVRVEMMEQFGYFVTESSPHNSEYLPYFRQDAGYRAQYGLSRVREVPLEWDPERSWEKDSGVESDVNAVVPPLVRSHEYAASIIEAMRTNQPFLFNGNVMNEGSITNLPAESCVEVPCVVDSQGLHVCQVGKLPTQCAALNRTNINVQELAVQAVMEGDREAAFHAVALDPLTAAILPLNRIRSMFDEMWEAQGDLLDGFEQGLPRPASRRIATPVASPAAV